MSNAQTVKAQIQSLINKANTTTGNTDTNLTDGVNALISGYGQGSASDLPIAEESRFGGEATGGNKFYYNGVLLPEIPQDVLADYPYCWIRLNSDGVTYDFVLGKYVWYYASEKLMITSSTYVWYTAAVDSESLTYKTSYTDDGKFGLGNGLVWSNHDIYSNADTIYFEATELVPEVQDAIWYQITGNTLTDIADSIQAKTGKTETMMASEMASEIDSISSSGCLEGLVNGYDVTFYDENNEGLAFYSIKQGHTINPPEYQVKGWQTVDGATIEFPYTPSADVVLYANNSTYADQLYEFYGIDKGVYPYICLKYDPASQNYGSSLCFLTTPITTTAQRLTCMYGSGRIDISDFGDLESVTAKIMSAITSVSLTTLTSTALDDTEELASRGRTYYTNYDATLTYVQIYRLDE